MAATIVVTCPVCKKQVSVSEEIVGKKVRCKGCEAIFTAKASKAPAPTGKSKEAPAKGTKATPAKKSREDDANPYGLTHVDLSPRCPFCAKELDEDAVICISCGYNTVTRARTETKRTVANTGGDQIMWLMPGILAVVGVLGIFAFDYWFWTGSWWDEMADAWGTRQIPQGLRVWGIIISLFVIFVLGRFAFKRLVLNPVRPERVKY